MTRSFFPPAEAGYDKIFRFGLPFLAAFLGVFLAGCSLHGKTEQWDLSPGAQQIYSYLVLQDAMVRGDSAAVLQSLEELRSADPDVRIFRDSADYFLLRKELDTCRRVAAEGLTLFPNDIQLYQILTEALIQGGRLEDAALALETFVEDSPENYEALQELARVRIMMQQFREAEKTIDRIPAGKRTPAMLYIRAMALLGQDRVLEGEKELARVVAEDPGFSDAWINMALAAQGQRQHEKAAGIYRRALTHDEGNPTLWLRLIDAYIRGGQNEKAFKALSEAPGIPLLRAEAAALFIEAGDYKNADRALEPFRNMPGAPDEVYFYLAAVALEYTKNPEDALRALSRVPSHSRLAERAMLWRLEILTDEGRSEEAMAIVTKHLADKGHQPGPYVTAAATAARLKRPDDAVRFLRQGLELFPGHSEMTYRLANILDEEGKKTEAFGLMEGLLEHEPDNPYVLNYVGYSLADENRELERAHGLLERAVALEPEDPHIADSLAWVLYRMGEYEDAWKAIRRSVELGGTHWVIWDHYGDIARQVGNTAEARRGYQNALEGGPDDPELIQKKLNAF